MKHNEKSETNDNNRKHLSEKMSSQESQSSRNLAVDTSRSSSRREKKVKKFNCKKGARAKECQDNSCHVLAHDYQKVGMEKYGNNRNVYGATSSGNEKKCKQCFIL